MNVILLGATGSVGTQTLELLKQHGDTLIGFSFGENLTKAITIIDSFNPQLVCATHEVDAKELKEAYQDVTGDTLSPPVTIGGGTYARMLPNAVAFGALLPGREDVAHRVNEYMIVEDLYTAVDIYTQALLALAT